MNFSVINKVSEKIPENGFESRGPFRIFRQKSNLIGFYAEFYVVLFLGGTVNINIYVSRRNWNKNLILTKNWPRNRCFPNLCFTRFCSVESMSTQNRTSCVTVRDNFDLLENLRFSIPLVINLPARSGLYNNHKQFSLVFLWT